MWLITVLAFVNSNYRAILLMYKIFNKLIKYLNMATEKGYWSKAAEKGCGKFADDKIKIKGAAGVIIEAFDGTLATYGIAYLDDNYSKYLPEAFVPAFKKLGLAFEAYSSDSKLDLSTVINPEELAIVLNGLVDVPKMTEDEEAILMAAILQGVFTVLQNTIFKSKEG